METVALIAVTFALFGFLLPLYLYKIHNWHKAAPAIALISVALLAIGLGCATHYILTAALIAVMFALFGFLLALYLYKIHNWHKAAPAIALISVALLAIGLCATHYILTVALLFGTGMTIFIWQNTRKLSGRWIHLARGLATGICLIPVLGIGRMEIEYLHEFGPLDQLILDRFLFWLVTTLPGACCAACIASLISYLLSLKKRPVVCEHSRRYAFLTITVFAVYLTNWYSLGWLNLYHVAQNDQTAILRYVFWFRPGVVKVRDHFGNNLLSYAARSGRIAAVKALLSMGIDVNQQYRRGQSPPLYAGVRGMHVDVVRTLLAAGADPNIVCVEFMLGATKTTPLHVAAGNGSLTITRALIEAGADLDRLVDTQIDSGYSALHSAAGGGNPKVIKELIDAGADIERKTVRRGSTPIFWAVFEGNLDAVKELVALGADYDVRDSLGRSPLEIANALDQKRISSFLETKYASNSDKRAK